MSSQWERFDRYYLRYPDLHFALDISRIDFDDNYFEAMNSRVERALQAMQQLEKGAIANPDEKRMVGHYWLRAPELAPNSQVRREVEDTSEAIYEFVRTIDSGEVKTQNGSLLELQARLVKELGSRKGKAVTAGELAKAVQADTEDIFHVLTHLPAPGGKVVRHRVIAPPKILLC
jgi:glucose-6-phosphate isomerase